MRVVNGVLCVILILFVVVQYNDPDALLWGVIYGVGALWTGLVAFRAPVLAAAAARLLLGVCVAAAFAGMAYYWPTTPQWWMQDVWWQTETAREGMGMMIVLAAMVMAGLATLTGRRSRA